MSGWRLTLDGARADLIGWEIRDHRNAHVRLQSPGVHVELERSLTEAGVEDALTLTTADGAPAAVHLELEWEFDFADIFEVRGLEPPRSRAVQVATTEGIRGPDAPLAFTARYTSGSFGRAVVITVEHASSEPSHEAGRIRFEALIPPDDAWHARISWRPRLEAQPTPRHRAADAPRVEVRTSNAAAQRVIQRALDDLHSLRLPYFLRGETHAVAAAGVPWFVALFGRDSLIVGMDAAWSFPDYLRGALVALAEQQADAHEPERKAEPGKILHELRRGELAARRLIPWSPYYGSHDATSLFIIAAEEAYAWTGDASLLRTLQPSLERALEWIDRYGDCDSDGLQEYESHSARGMSQQGWKDSGDAIVDAAGRVPPGPIALCEHQALAYAAMRSLASLYESGGHAERAVPLRESAARLRDRFNEAFWWEAEGTYVLALDGEKRPLHTVASNAGQCLASGIVPPERAARVAERLMADDVFSGWGIRTLSATHPTYDPISYHLGSVWPHDNAAIATGLLRTGHRREAAAVAEGLFAAADAFPDARLPELIGGDSRSIGPPARPPEANAPQAWAASAILRLVTLLCGIQADAPAGKLYADPDLPAWLPDIEIRNLRAAGGSVDIRFHGREMDVQHNTTGLEIVHGTAEGGPM